jgi:hypothetical protein
VRALYRALNTAQPELAPHLRNCANAGYIKAEGGQWHIIEKGKRQLPR